MSSYFLQFSSPVYTEERHLKMASKRAKDIQMGKPAKPAKSNIAKRAMLMKRPPPSDAEVMDREEEVKETKMAAVREWLSTVSPSRELDVDMSAWLGERIYHQHSPPTRCLHVSIIHIYYLSAFPRNTYLIHLEDILRVSRMLSLC